MSYRIYAGGKDTAYEETYTMVLDAKALDPNRGAEEIMTPRVQVEILQLLAKIHRRDPWEMWVLFNGPELPQVPHGGDFLGIRVFFSPTPPQRIPTLMECVNVLQKRGDHVLMVTQDLDLEHRCRGRKVPTLRGETFKKGYDELFIVRHRPQSRLMRMRTTEMEKDRLDRDQQSTIRSMIDLVE